MLVVLIASCTRLPTVEVPTLAELPTHTPTNQPTPLTLLLLTNTIQPPGATTDPLTIPPAGVPNTIAPPVTFTPAPTLAWTPIQVQATLAPFVPSPVPPTATYTPVPTLVPPPDVRLHQTPVFYNFDSPRLREIFAHGQALGNQPQVFVTVGDSNTTNGDFLKAIGYELAYDQPYCEWGDYAYLQTTAQYFSVSPDGISDNSFTRDGAAAREGFNSAALLDPFWTDHRVCNGDNALVCDYRSARPSVAVIMLGGIDVKEITVAEYRANMTQAVELSIERGVIPVLTTFVVLPERADIYPSSLEFNAALLDISETYGVPLINLWGAVQALPDWGIGPDRSHLKARPGDYCTFTGAQNELGGTLRNLLTLQALDLLRTQVLSG